MLGVSVIRGSATRPCGECPACGHNDPIPVGDCLNCKDHGRPPARMVWVDEPTEKEFDEEDLEEECVWCGEKRSPDQFEDGLRCKLCAEKDEDPA